MVLLQTFVTLLSLLLTGSPNQEPPPPRPDILVIRGARILAGPRGQLQESLILIRNGKIAAVGRHLSVPEGARVIEAEGQVVAPLFLDGRSQAFLDDRTRSSRGWNTAARVADGLRSFDPEAARRLLRGGVGVSFQMRGGMGPSGATGALTTWLPHEPAPRILDAAAGVEFDLTHLRPRRSRGPVRGGFVPLPFKSEAASPALVVLDHGDHVHVLRSLELKEFRCPLGDHRQDQSRPARDSGRLELRPLGKRYQLVAHGEEPLPESPEGFWGLEDGGAGPFIFGADLPRGGIVLPINEEGFLVTPGSQNLTVCPHCMLAPVEDPGPFAEGPPRAPGSVGSLPLPVPQETSLLARSSMLRPLEAAFARAKSYRKSLQKYTKDLAAFKKKLAAWKKGHKTSAKPAPAASGASKKSPRLKLPKSFRKLPLRERIRYLRKLRKMRGASTSATHGSRKQGQGRPVAPSKPSLDPASEALLAVIDGQRPLRVEVNWKEDILRVLKLARKEQVAVVLLGATEGWKVLDEIKEARAMVLLGAPENLTWERMERINWRPDLAVLLARAGIPFGFMTAVPGFRGDSLAMIAELQMAAGLSREAALKALTTDAARVLGLSTRMGSLEPGHEAWLQILTGEPLDPATRVKRVVIKNTVVDL